MTPQIIRCDWAGNSDPAYVEYHDREWGVPVRDDRIQFEFLILEGGSVLMLPTPNVAEEAEAKEEVIRVAQLLRPYPNPFNPTVHFEFTLKAASRVRLSIYDVRGRRVADLVKEVLPQGRYEQTWLGRDKSDRQMASGVYFARMLADGESWTHRLVLVK